MHTSHSAICLLFLVVTGIAADPIDWVNINYVKQAKSNSATSNAQSGIASKAETTAKNGPWVIQTKGIKPPSGDVRDYLSWAPYHWPDCKWCSKGSTHYINTNGTDDQSPEVDEPSDNQPDDSTNYPDGYPGYPDDEAKDDSVGPQDGFQVEDLKNEIAAINFAVVPLPTHSSSFIQGSKAPGHRIRRMHRMHMTKRAGMETIHRRQLEGLEGSASSTSSIVTSSPSGNVSASVADLPFTPTLPLDPDVPQATGLLPTTSTSNKVAGTQAPAQAPAKTQNAQAKCTPSPTKSLAPSATWTTCPYVVRDGKVNPDTDSLVGPDAAQDMSKSVIFNAIAYTLQKTNSYSKNAANAIDAFFLSSSTGMNPNVNFGQLVRGPGKDHQIGTFTGILDLRGMVKVSNAVQLMRATSAPDWTPARDSSMSNWMKSYISWLQTSNLGKSVATKANNHLTFYVAQLVAVKIALGDNKGASDALQKYFSNQFLDQIAQSGEQPFESVRTRPFHYRCFNLEAMISLAKMGDQLGMNLWTAKSKYGATIQTALDFTMNVNPKGEDISDIIPHVAAVAAAYGDPKGKYAAFLQKNMPSFKTQPFWFYDQSAALPNSPAGKAKRSDDDDDNQPGEGTSTTPTSSDDSTTAPNTDVEGTHIKFECPAVFKYGTSTELEDGLFVTCDQLKPFYELFL